MMNESNFIARKSGSRVNSYYIDYSGVYRVIDIAKVAGLEPSAVKEIYLDNGGIYDEALEVFYFGSLEAARKAISDICGNVRTDRKERLIVLSEAEVEYIRMALINEGSNNIHLSSRIKDAIFRKLNG